MPVWLEKIQINNYRSLKHATFAPNERLSALIGANGSGKTNVLTGIMLLNKMVRSHHPHAGDEFALSVCKIKCTFNVSGKRLYYESLVHHTTTDKNVDEVARSVEKWNFKEFTDDPGWLRVPLAGLMDFFEYVDGDAGQLSFFRSNRLRVPGYRGNVALPEESALKKIAPVVKQLRDFLAGMTYYSASQFTDPSKSPTYFEVEGEGGLSRKDIIYRRTRSARPEHAQFMQDLYLTSRENRDKFDEFLSIVGRQGIHLIDDIKFRPVPAPSRDIKVYTGGKFERRVVTRSLIIPTFVIRGTKLSPNQLSEGTFKTLAVIFYLVTDKSHFLLLEEPEVCVHHGLLNSTLELIKDFSREKQIMITTHSDFVLDGLSPENVYLVKMDSTKGTVVRHVPKAMSARDYRALRLYLEEDGNLGEFWRHSGFEK